MTRALRDILGMLPATVLVAASCFLAEPGRASGAAGDAGLAERSRAYFDLCSRLEPLPSEDQDTTLAAAGFRPFDHDFAAFIRDFYEERGQILAAYHADPGYLDRWGENASAISDTPVSFHGRTPRYFLDAANWLLRLDSPSHLGARGGVPWGDAHACRFYGNGWMPEEVAEALVADYVGPDFDGRGHRNPRQPEFYVVSGEPVGAAVPYPYLSVKAVVSAGGFPAQTELYYAVVRERNRDRVGDAEARQ